MTPVVSLALATAAFVGTHLLMSHPLRPALVGRLGAQGFLGLYSLVSLATLGWMVLAWRAGTDSVPLWVAPLWWWPIASAFMLAASILLVGSFNRNPAFPHPGAGARDIPTPRGVFAITRHPMNWSFILWALVHISLSGSARNLIVAGGILLLAWVGSLGQDRKKAGLIGDAWRDWARRTSFLPFGALASGRVPWRSAFPGWTALIGGLVLWAVVTSFHAPLVSPLGDLLSRS
ncbi:NnrU family protein [Sphingosinicella sp. LHD-64]|uniref:NnrU family protein n=1 Tax=Sphingosinicella sp. LHD-64 TaxID=3072139 RepID=UPI00281006B5|nr:NnrU family protein [Sphingosinicella sp. LHD-64]MDQ8757893.1 NnrU family protein [Sphingosinicella sp. LHD-64]